MNNHPNALDWDEIGRLVKPSPSYDRLVGQLLEVYAYEFVRGCYDHSLPEARAYAGLLLGQDPRQRYGEWLERLQATFRQLERLGLHTCLEFIRQVESRQKLEAFYPGSGLQAAAILDLLKYLLNWVLPGKIYLKELVEDEPTQRQFLAALREHGIRFNLDLLERCRTPEGRQAWARATGLPEEFLLALVHRADLTRLPYVRGSTARNYANSGYGSLAKLAAAGLPQLTADFTRYGQSIGKNLKIGVELDSGIAIARVLPKVVEE